MSWPTEDNLQLWICLAIVVLGLVVYGFKDLIRFSLGRVWAISSVCFAESVRRKIWVITPLAIIGVIIVAQLQRPMDERDAIRETVKFCLFAIGLVITITAIILACTNLPREIENRVIYTIVTKPTTRLEIVLGKIVGFARVSALILVIMGLFTFGYIHWRAWRLENEISERLTTQQDVDEASRPTLEYYKSTGLLTARVMANADSMNIYAHPPTPGSERQFIAPMGAMLVPFEAKPVDLVPVGASPANDLRPGEGGLLVVVRIGARGLPVAAKPVKAPATLPVPKPPQLFLQVLDANLGSVFSSQAINGGEPVPLSDPTGATPTLIQVPPAAAQQICKPGIDLEKPIRFNVLINGSGEGYEFFVERDPIFILVPPLDGHQPRQIQPAPSSQLAGKPSQPEFRGREGTSGQQIRGSKSPDAGTAVYQFTNAAPVEPGNNVSFEFKTGIERDDSTENGTAAFTRISVTAFDRDTQKESDPVIASLESNRLAYITLPASILRSGNFDIRLRCISESHFLGLFPTSLTMVKSTHGFDLNLILSLLIVWLMSVLIISIAIFTSTFLSWPTAIVLTLVIFLGRWGVEQLGDAAQPGIGNLIAQDMGFQDPNKARVVSSVAEALTGGLNILAKVLPDISRFDATSDLERGLIIPPTKIWEAVQVLLTYGLAMMTMAYVRLKWVEVAP